MPAQVRVQGPVLVPGWAPALEPAFPAALALLLPIPASPAALAALLAAVLVLVPRALGAVLVLAEVAWLLTCTSLGERADTSAV